MLKFLLETALAAVMLILLSPVILVCVLLVRAGSPGSGVFRQERVGRHEIPFICYKLRTMHVTTANVPTHEASALSITPIGHFLRRSKLDELPQLLNVLRGEMSFVGPRPCLPTQTELIVRRRELGVFSVRPGITGLAQIQGVDMSEPVKLAQIDRQYIHDRSLAKDLRILLATAFGSGRGDRVRRVDTPTERPDAR